MKKEQFVELTSNNGEESVVVINVKHITHMNEYDQGVVVIMTSIPTKLGKGVIPLYAVPRVAVYIWYAYGNTIVIGPHARRGQYAGRCGNFTD